MEINMEINIECGKRLKRARMSKGYSQIELANMAHYSKQTVNYVENGKRPLTNEAAHIFSEILCVREEYLLCKDDFATEYDFSEEKSERIHLRLKNFGIFLSTEYRAVDLENGNFAIIGNDKKYVCSSKELKHLHEALDILEQAKKDIVLSFVKGCSRLDSENQAKLHEVQEQHKQTVMQSKMEIIDSTINKLVEPEIQFD